MIFVIQSKIPNPFRLPTSCSFAQAATL